MYDQPRASPSQAAMTFDQMLERVRCEAAHPTRERAEGAVRTVLAALGRQLTGEERIDLAQGLWDTGAVLAVVTRLAGPDLLARILRRPGPTRSPSATTPSAGRGRTAGSATAADVPPKARGHPGPQPACRRIHATAGRAVRPGTDSTPRDPRGGPVGAALTFLVARPSWEGRHDARPPQLRAGQVWMRLLGPSWPSAVSSLNQWSPAAR
ncbi:DUF2267 domain-containing protein [Streptomyces erythrochromogenes]|nr:DUF2267 domain-containing protein [Streptomyces erythrochromogenes]